MHTPCTAVWTMLVVLASLLGACAAREGARASGGASGGAPHAAAFAEPFGDLRLNQVQVIGSHNSYKIAPEPALLAIIETTSRNQAQAIDYTHLRVADQLALGLRNLEIDICYDPDGGRYATPLGNKLLAASGATPKPFNADGSLDTPGFKVIHDTDFDFRSHHHDFRGYLAEMRAWSAKNPRHEPVIVTMNCKTGKSRFPGGVDCADFTEPAFEQLDATVREHLGEAHLCTPDLVRGGAETLEGAILSRGWPTIRELRGRFIFVLDEGGVKRERYVRGHPSLRGRVFFTTSDPGTPEAAILIINDPVKDQARIRDLVSKGYVVRTRADADTREARAGTRERFEAAKACGAQVITTDYPIPDRKINPDYMVRFDDGGFVRENPVTGAAGATRAAGDSRIARDEPR
ncbi:MAG: phosphatidylinositol-specific phospholipase C1-like protein [Planctomycetota bacterium]|nr:phosphatidylinositol-specific phospholipase C1-like protein [Planctomycetota bacterium]